MLSLYDKSDFELMARLSTEPSVARLLNWVSESRDHYLQQSMQSEQSRDDRVTALDKAKVLNDMLETIEKAPETLRGWPEESDANPHP